jgi:hypothetical protein
MSHHLDSPIARQDPRLDITDLYVFLRWKYDVAEIVGAGALMPFPSPVLTGSHCDPLPACLKVFAWRWDVISELCA